MLATFELCALRFSGGMQLFCWLNKQHALWEMHFIIYDGFEAVLAYFKTLLHF